MKYFMDENFLLENEIRKKLYYEFVKEMPIFDYHCHLSPKEISEDKSYENLTQVWLYGDHYKWRAMRNNNTAMFEKLGLDIGMDSIGDNNYAESISHLLDSLEKTNELPKTILYSLNPKDNEMLGAILGNFQSSERPGKIQLGSGWWFLDQKTGMINQMTTLVNLGLLNL